MAQQQTETATLEAIPPNFEPFIFKWQREARLLRRRARDFNFVGESSKAYVCDAKASVIEEMISALQALTE